MPIILPWANWPRWSSWHKPENRATTPLSPLGVLCENIFSCSSLHQHRLVTKQVTHTHTKDLAQKFKDKPWCCLKSTAHITKYWYMETASTVYPDPYTSFLFLARNTTESHRKRSSICWEQRFIRSKFPGNKGLEGKQYILTCLLAEEASTQWSLWPGETEIYLGNAFESPKDS